MPVLKTNINGKWMDIASAYTHKHKIDDIEGFTNDVVDNIKSVVDLVKEQSIPEQIALAVQGVKYEHPDRHPASMIDGLSDVAKSGDYNDLINKPKQVQADWNTTNTNDVSYIKNKPTILKKSDLATVADSGDYNDLINKPKQVQADWDTTNTNDASYIKNKPIIPSIEGLATEQFVQDAIANLNISGGTGDSGSGGGDIQPDWNQNDDTQLDYIKNKPFNESPVEYKIIDNKEYSFTDEGGLYGSIDMATPDDEEKFNKLTNIVNLFNTKWTSATVVWGETTYSDLKPEYVNNDETKIIGNPDLFGGVDNELPFIITAQFLDGEPGISIISLLDTEETVRRISVTLYDIEIKKLDNKYLDILDYIDGTEEDILPIGTWSNFTLNSMFNVNMQTSDTVINLNIGETYNVRWNNDIFNCVVQDVGAMMPGHVALGNCAAFDDAFSGNNEPFIIAANATSTIVIPLLPDTTEATVRIYKVFDGHYELKDEYKPTDADWDNLKNKPFGEENYLEEATLPSSVSFDIGDGILCHKLFDITPSKDEYMTSVMTVKMTNGAEITYKLGKDTITYDDSSKLLSGTDYPFVICYEAGTYSNGKTITFPEPGFYFINTLGVPNGTSCTLSITLTNKLNNKYLSILNFINGKEIDILPNTKLGPFSYDSSYGCFTTVTNADYMLTIGETYYVVWDSNTFKCIAQDADKIMPGTGLIGLGNCVLFNNTFSGNNEPFIIGLIPGAGITYMSTTDTEARTHNVRIYQKTDDVYVFNDKYMPDWDQGDPNLPGYIKNKPFGKIFNKHVVVSGTFIYDVTNNIPYTVPNTSNIHLTIGQKYTVIYNGVTYSCICETVETFPAIGNTKVSTGNDNGMPFIITEDQNNLLGLGQGFICIHVYTPDDPSVTEITTDITILYEGINIKKIDLEYIDQSDWNNYDENSTAYIKNKPFYSIPANTIINNITVSCTMPETETDYMGFIPEPLRVVNGVPYTVIYDGIEYNNIIMEKQNDYEHICAIDTIDGGLIVIIYFNNMWVLFAPQGEHTLIIKTTEEFIQKIDKMFIPKVDGLPEINKDEDEGKSLKVVNGVWTVSEALPNVTEVDAGKFLRVSSSGKWVIDTVLNAEEVNF